jgi:L-ribulose-5-phosphate 3-epimerase
VNRIAIMQGRLSPPVGGQIQAFPVTTWADEFRIAARAGFGAIEWIYDAMEGDKNPLTTATGRADIKGLSAATGVAVRSVCADFFMRRRLLHESSAENRDNVDHLAWLLDVLADLGVSRVVLPFVDSSKVADQGQFDTLVGLLGRVAPEAAVRGVELHLETDLPPDLFRDLLRAVGEANVRVNYDSGNSSSLGYHPSDEFAVYGNLVGSVHIKDRVRGGSTVPLGQGDADFEDLFTQLVAIGYRGDYVLQVARGERGSEEAWAHSNKSWLDARLARHGLV